MPAPKAEPFSAHARQLWRSIPWLGGALVAVFSAYAGYDLVRSYRSAVDQTGRELETRARVIAEQTTRSMQSVDLVLRHLARTHRTGVGRSRSRSEMRANLQDQVIGMVQIETLAMFDANGNLVANSMRDDAPALRIDLANDPAFRSLRLDRNPPLSVGNARAALFKPDTWVFPIARRLDTRDGDFDGIVFAGGRVEYFEQFYRDLRLGEGTAVTLLHRDGTLLARHPSVPEALGRRHAAIGDLLAAGARAGAGPHRAVSPIDGVDRFGAVKVTADYPLAVIVTRDAAVALGAWRAQAIGTVTQTLVLGLLSALLLVMVRRQFARLDRTRESLELSRERFSLAAAGSDEGIWDWDVGSDSIYASARAREIFGLPPGSDDQPRQKWFEAARMHPDDVDARRRALRAHLAGATPVYAGEYRVGRPDGTYRWIRVRGLCVRDAAGAPLRMAGSVTDIDAQRRAEDALRLSEERYALAMTGSTGGHWVWDVASDALFVSSTLNQLFGLPVDTQPQSRTAYFGRIVAHPDDQRRIAMIDDDVRRGGASRIDFEYRIVLPDGGIRWILTRAQCFRDADGQTVRVAGVSVDIDARKRTEEALRLSEERFALAVAGSNDGVIDWDIVNDRMYTSERMLEMIGSPTTQTIRTRAEWIALLDMPPDDRRRHADELQRFLAGRELLRDAEYRLRRADGEYRWVRLRNYCVRDSDGKPLRLAGSVSDIDAYKRVEAALRESEERYALAMTGSNEGHWVWDLASDDFFVSARLNQILGMPGGAGVVKYSAYFAQVPRLPEDDARVREARDELLAGITPQMDVEYRITLPGSGAIRWIHSRGQCFRDADGRPVRMAGSSMDITERKQAEEALRQSEQRFALAVAGSDDGVWDFDYVNQRVFASRRGREMLGVPLEPEVQSLDEWFAQLRLHPDDTAVRLNAMQAHLAGEIPAYEGEWRVAQPDGSYRWLRVRGMCVRDASGAPLRMAGSVSDIDARKRAEDSLRQSQERYALAVAGSDDGVWDWDFSAGIAFESARARELQGLPPGPQEQPLADMVDSLRVHPEDAPRRAEGIRAHLAGETPAYECEYRVRHDDGHYRWIRVRALCIRDADGEPCRMAGSVSDIDARKRAEDALQRSEERYQLAVAGSNEGLWDWDLTSDSLFLSPRAQELFWHESGEPLRPRREWLALTHYHPDDLPLVRNAISAHLHGDTLHFKVEYRVLHYSGDWRWYRQRGVAVRDAAGRPTRMAGSMEDISERKRSEAERERLEVQLRQAQKLEAIGTLAGGIAHDFNNILAAILGYGEMALKDAASGSAQRRHIDAAMSAGMRAKSLVERILAFSRSGMGERLPVHVQSVVAEALDIVAESLPSGITLERHLDCGDAGVFGDPTQVQQVVVNLCANAVQAMRGGGTLSVRLAQVELHAPRCLTSTLPDGNYTALSVGDTGSGIAPNLLERIFDPFFTTKEVGVGTGLGLSLVHGIVTDLGGGICVDSQVGQGSIFHVYLPWQGCVTAPAPLVEESPAPNGNGETILLVDDEEPLVRLGEEMIAQLGYEPVGFTSSMAALATLRCDPQRFNAVLSDEAMPEMTGSELILEIRKIRPDIPIVLMSGYVTNALSARARDAGVVEVLSKPLVSRDIARSLSSALQR